VNREPKSPLAVRTIEGPLAFTASSTWVWFSVPTQRWAFRADDARLNLVMDIAARVVALAGHRAHWRITNRPYPASSWARGLDRETPSPIPGYAAHLDTVRQHVERSTMSEKEVYLGIEMGSRSTWATSLVDKALRRPTASESGKAEKESGIIARGLAQAGIEATLVSDAQMEWLIRRSLGLGLAAPGALSPVKDGRWETEDLAELTDAVEATAEVGADTVRISRRGSSETVYVAVMSVGRVDEIEVADPRHAPWLAAADSLPFPVEWSIRQEVLDGEAATKAVQHKLLIVRDMQRHYHDHDLDEPLALERQARAGPLRLRMRRRPALTLKAARVHGWYRLAVYWVDRGGGAGPNARMVHRPVPQAAGHHRPARKASTGRTARVHPRRARLLDDRVPPPVAGRSYFAAGVSAVVLVVARGPAWPVHRAHGRAAAAAPSCSIPTSPPRSGRCPASSRSSEGRAPARASCPASSRTRRSAAASPPSCSTHPARWPGCASCRSCGGLPRTSTSPPPRRAP
jgi:hypothetical protein